MEAEELLNTPFQSSRNACEHSTASWLFSSWQEVWFADDKQAMNPKHEMLTVPEEFCKWLKIRNGTDNMNRQAKLFLMREEERKIQLMTLPFLGLDGLKTAAETETGIQEGVPAYDHSTGRLPLNIAR